MAQDETTLTPPGIEGKEIAAAFMERRPLCPQLDIASQGEAVEVASRNLIEALELFFESAGPTDVNA